MTCNNQVNLITAVQDEAFSIEANPDYLFYVYEKKVDLIIKFGNPIYVPESKNSYKYPISDLKFHNGNFWSAYLFPYRINCYDENYSLKTVITRKNNFFSKDVEISYDGFNSYFDNKGKLNKISLDAAYAIALSSPKDQYPSDGYTLLLIFFKC